MSKEQKVNDLRRELKIVERELSSCKDAVIQHWLKSYIIEIQEELVTLAGDVAASWEQEVKDSCQCRDCASNV